MPLSDQLALLPDNTSGQISEADVRAVFQAVMDALDDDENFSTAVAAAIATKLAKTANLADLASAAIARTNLGITAANVPLTPTGDVAATDVQAGIAELSSEKQTAAQVSSAIASALAAYITTAFDWKASVRVATTAPGTLASSFENGDTIDGVALATGDRILIKDQAATADNGIYTVNASGAPTRSTDADASAEVTAGLAVPVVSGTANGGRVFILTTPDPITLGSTGLTFARLDAGDLAAANNLSDLTNVGTARTNLGLVIGTHVQAYDDQLAALAALAPGGIKLPYYTGSGPTGAALTDLTPAALSSFTPTLTGTVSNPNLGTGGSRADFAYYGRVGRMILAVIRIIAGNTSVTAGSGTYEIALPVNAAVPGLPCGFGAYVDASANNLAIAPYLSSATKVAAYLIGSAANTSVGSAAPGLAANDNIWMTLFYEAAT